MQLYISESRYAGYSCCQWIWMLVFSFLLSFYLVNVALTRPCPGEKAWWRGLDRSMVEPMAQLNIDRYTGTWY